MCTVGVTRLASYYNVRPTVLLYSLHTIYLCTVVLYRSFLLLGRFTIIDAASQESHLLPSWSPRYGRLRTENAKTKWA